MLDEIAYSLGRNDEEPNINLAIKLCEKEDKNGIKDIVLGLKNKKQEIANDCMKVLYEIGERKPSLIEDYICDFIELLNSKNNRLVWGAMTALSKIAPLKPNGIMQHIDKVIEAYKKGSVITIDNSISVFAELVKAKVDCSSEIFELILKHLKSCRAKEVAQHSERAFICINKDNATKFKEVIEQRIDSLSIPQQKRLNKIIKKMETGQFEDD